MSTLTDTIAATMRQHEYALGFDGIASDGEIAWLQCTCGWKFNYEMPEDDIRLAERVWDRHRAEAIAGSMSIEWVEVDSNFGSATEFGSCNARAYLGEIATVCGYPRLADGTCLAGHPAAPTPTPRPVAAATGAGTGAGTEG